MNKSKTALHSSQTSSIKHVGRKILQDQFILGKWFYGCLLLQNTSPFIHCYWLFGKSSRLAQIFWMASVRNFMSMAIWVATTTSVQHPTWVLLLKLLT